MNKYPLVKVEKQETAGYPYDKWFKQHVEIAEALVRGDKREDGAYGFHFIHENQRFPDPDTSVFILNKFFDRVRSVAELHWTGIVKDHKALSKWHYETLRASAKIYDIAAEHDERHALETLERITELTPEIYVFRPTVDAANRVKRKLESCKSGKGNLRERIFAIFSKKDKDKISMIDYFKRTFLVDFEKQIIPEIYRARGYRANARSLDEKAEYLNSIRSF